MNNRKTLIIVGFVGLILLIIGLVVYSLIPRATLIMSVAPEEMTLVINGTKQTIKTGQSVTVTPGELTIELQRTEFDTHTEKISIKNGEEKEILFALNPQTDAARELLTTPASMRILERIGGKAVQEGAEKLSKIYPILKDLPITDKFYTIKPCSSRITPDDKSKIAVCITLFDMAAKQSAITDLERRGYMLSEYEVVFIDGSYTTTSSDSGE